jgi:hypothetical protein
METVYLVCAAVGGTLLLCQFLLGLFGLGSHDAGHGFGHADASHDGHDGHDAGHEGTSAWYLGLLTFRTVTSALIFFGLAGLAATAAEMHPVVALLVALAAGGGALYLVAFLMRTLYRLKADGTVRLERAVGTAGTVYLRVPGHHAGAGKVTLTLQNRTVEVQALTGWDELPTGARVVVVAVVGPDTVEVSPAPAEAPTHV